MDSIEVSGGLYVSKGSHVQLTENAKNIPSMIDGERQLTPEGQEIKKYSELMKDMLGQGYDYLLVMDINNTRSKKITVKIPDDVNGSYDIYEPTDLKCTDNCYIPRPQTPPALPYNQRFFKGSTHTGQSSPNTADPLSPARWGRRFKRTRRNNRKRKTRRSSNRK
jgi:hypothetical protein